MRAEDIINAMEISCADAISDAAEQRSREKRRFGAKKLTAVAAAAAVILVGAAAAAAGGLIDVKNSFGTVIGQEYQGDASDEISIRFLGFENGEPNLDITFKDPNKAPYLDVAKGLASIKPLSYEVTGAGELLKKWVEEKEIDGGGIYFDDMHPLIAIGRLVDAHKMSEEEKREKEIAFGIDFDDLEPVGEPTVGCEAYDCRTSDGSIRTITISRRVYYVDKTTGEEISFPTESETYEAKDLAPWKVPINATGSEYDPTVPPKDGVQIVTEDENAETVTPEDGYNTLDELEPLKISIEGLLIESKGDQPLEIRGHWIAEFEV